MPLLFLAASPVSGVDATLTGDGRPALGAGIDLDESAALQLAKTKTHEGVGLEYHASSGRPREPPPATGLGIKLQEFGDRCTSRLYQTDVDAGDSEHVIKEAGAHLPH